MDLVTLGEALMDLPALQTGVGLANAQSFAKVPAGAPANVAVAAARLGLRSAFITKVGADPFGDAILQTFAARGVDMTHARQDPAARTGLAFVGIDETGERDFLFYFDPARDLALRPDELNASLLRTTNAFHFGSISLSAQPCRRATLAAIRHAFNAGALISYDPNLRPRLWASETEMRTHALSGFAHAHVAKVSKDELDFLMPGTPDAAARLMQTSPILELLCVTDGRDGSVGWHAGDGIQSFPVPACVVDTVDATGAGDAYVAGLLTVLLREPDPRAALRQPETITRALRHASACGAIAAAEHGAGMLTLTPDAVQSLLARTGTHL